MNSILLLIPILLPLLSGAVLLFLPHWPRRRRNGYTFTVACITSVIIVILLFFVQRDTITVFRFTQDFSLSFRVDGLASLFAGMLALMWPPALLYAYEYMEQSDHCGRFFAFYLMTYGITLGVAFSANLITMYVFFELLTLITLPLVAHYQDSESLHAAQLYIIYCVAGAALGFIAVVLGTLDGSGSFCYGGSLSGQFAPAIMGAAFLCGFFGFGAKGALFPLFHWLPTASVAPTPVTALLHAVAVVNTGFFAVTRLSWFSFGPGLLLGSPVQTLCVAVAALSMVFGAIMALKERHFKRRLAYSTMSNLSYMLFGTALMTPAGLLGALAHMLFHGVIKMSMFLCAGSFMHVTGKKYLYEINGVGRQMPFTFITYTLGAMSLTGIPLFCGFVSKWRLLTAGLHAGTPVALMGVAALLMSAFLCAIYTLTVSIRAFFSPGTPKNVEIHESGWRMLVPIGMFSVLNVLLGIWSGPVIEFLTRIAEGIL